MLAAGVALKLLPVMVTVVPIGPEVGEKPVITGGGINVKPGMLVLPPVVTMLMSPDAPPPETMAFMVVGEGTVNEVALIPPNFKLLTPIKLVPVNVTWLPAIACCGVKAVMVGGGAYVNPVMSAVKTGSVTAILPVAPLPTTALIVVAFIIENEAAGIPPKVTAVTGVKLVPVMVTVESVPATSGVKEVILGIVTQVKLAADPVPYDVVTETLPVALAPTTAVITVGETIVNDVALVPPNFTAVALVKF
jgi:hypothetical protein